ncbi:MAG: hypothetical protein AAF368_18065, partial [Planctomycetota bacterium]
VDAELRLQHGRFVDWSEVGQPDAFRAVELPRGAWAAQGTRVTICASGYRPKEIELKSLEEANALVRQELMVARVELEPGWETVLQTFDRRSRQPLAGVRVFCDGILSGVTGENGKLRLSADEIPQDLWLEREGYRWVDGDPVWLRTELLAQEDFEPRLWLSPEK